MAQISPFKLLVLAVVAVVFLTGSIVFYADLDQKYDPTNSENFDAVFADFSAVTDEVTNDTKKINEEIAANMSAASQTTALTTIGSQRGASFGALRIIFKIPGLVQNLFNVIAGYLFIPTWFVGLIVALAAALIAVVIILFVARFL